MNWISTLLGNLNYGTILLLMLLESTVIPVPSELVVAPAAYHAAGGSLNVWLVILFATIGADCGATINYVAGYYLGRPSHRHNPPRRLASLLLLSSMIIQNLQLR